MRRASEGLPIYSGTESSNPAPSSGESGANLRRVPSWWRMQLDVKFFGLSYAINRKTVLRLTPPFVPKKESSRATARPKKSRPPCPAVGCSGGHDKWEAQ